MGSEKTDLVKSKIEIALAKGKKIHDKRQDLKEKTLKRELREIKI